MVKKTNDDFNFATARGSSGRTAFRTPQMSKTQFTPQDKLAQKQYQTKGNWGDGGLQVGVSPYKMIYGAITKAAQRALLSGNAPAATQLGEMANTAKLVGRFPNSPGADALEGFFVKMGTQKMLGYHQGAGLKGPNISVEGFSLDGPELQVINRAGSKIIGNAARGEPSLRPMAKGFGVGAKGRTSSATRFSSVNDMFARMSRGLPSVGDEAYGPYSVRAEANGSMWKSNSAVTPGGTRMAQRGAGRYYEEEFARTRLWKTLEDLKALRARANPDGSMKPPSPRAPIKRGRL